MRPLKTAVILFIIIIFPCQVLASENIRKISVTGKSEITMEAQYAVIEIGIREVKDTMSQSHSLLLKTISGLTEGLKRNGLSDSDIKKSLILQGKEYSYGSKKRDLKGYYSECHIDLHVNDIRNLSSVYNELAKYENLTIRNTEFKRNDEFKVRQGEFEKALKAAKTKAQFMAKVLGAKIGKVHSIEETKTNNYTHINSYTNIRTTGRDNNQTGYGNLKITGAVTVEFELE